MNFLPRVSVVLLSLFLAACFDPASAPSDAPANVTVTEGESLVVMDWDVTPGLTYWIFFKQGTSAGLDDFGNILTGITPPVVVGGLENGTQYALAVTSSQAGSKVGPFSPVVTATPRLLSPAIDWRTTDPALGTENLLSITFDVDTYVTVGNAATVFVGPFNYPRTGGVTGWTQATSLPAGLTANLASVIYDGTRFVALGDDGSVIRSTDTESLTWEAATAIGGPPATMNALAITAGTYVAVGNSGEIYTNNTDGVTAAWTAQTSGTGNDLHSVSFVNGGFIAVGDLGTLLTSTDGVSWTTQTSNAGGNALRHVAFGAGIYVAVGDAGTIVSSTDATTWAAQTNLPSGESLRAITFGPDEQFIAVGTAGTLAYSLTGLDGSWAEAKAGLIDLNSIAPSAVFIAVGDLGANVSGK
jgi:hypothetical protein